MTKEEARLELFIFARNSFEEIMEKAKDFGIYDDFMMIATVGLVAGEKDGKNMVESISTIDVDNPEEMNSLLAYLATSYSEMDDDDDDTDSSDPDFWLNLN
jgi:choline kinase